MKNKAFRALVSAILPVLMLCGCSAGSDTYFEDENEEITETVTVSYSFTGSQTEKEMIQKLSEKYEEENPGVRIELEYYEEDDYEDIIRLKMLRREEADVVMYDYYLLDVFSKDGEGFVNLYEYSDVLDFSDYPETILNYGTRNGMLSGLCNHVSGSVPVFNKAIFDSYGLSLPTNLDELVKSAKVMSEDGIYPLVMDKAETLLYFCSLYKQNYDTKTFDADGNLKMSKVEIMELLQIYKRLIKEKAVMSVEMNMDKKVVEGQAAGIMCTDREVSYYVNLMNEAEGDPKVGRYTELGANTLSCDYARPDYMYSVSRHADNKEEAVKFLNYMIRSEDSVLSFGTSMGVPSNQSAQMTLMRNGYLNTEEYVASLWVEYKLPELMLKPQKLEDSEFVDKQCNVIKQYLAGSISVDKAAELMILAASE